MSTPPVEESSQQVDTAAGLSGGARDEQAGAGIDPGFLARVLADRGGRSLLPVPSQAAQFLDDAMGALFLPCSTHGDDSLLATSRRLLQLRKELGQLLGFMCHAGDVGSLVDGFMRALPGIYDALLCDATAILDGDPAAESLDEVITSYPGFFAIAAHRLAHELHQAKVPLLPRMLSEAAHQKTGIDIHPGASIGNCLCIDHGTGVVIGETAVVGDNVKIYQGVTLGAASVSKEARGKKRHPTVEDRVVLYAHATVLGGDTVIGHDTVIGGNVWVTSSVPPNSYVYHSPQVRVRTVSDLVSPSDYSI